MSLSRLKVSDLRFISIRHFHFHWQLSGPRTQPSRPRTKMEDDQNGRQLKWKTIKMEDDQKGRRPKWKTTKMEDDQNRRQPKLKTTKMEDDQNGRRLHQKRKTTLTKN